MKANASPKHHDDPRLRRFYDESAADDDLWMTHDDRVMLGDARRTACAQASGRTLELAVGTGLNLPFYPLDIRLTAVDASPAMLAIARRRAENLNLDAALGLSDARALHFPGGYFDTVVSSLFMCTVVDERQVAAEVWRVLKPGGRWLLIEQVRSRILPVRWPQRLLDPVLARQTGDRLVRDPIDDLAGIGFAIERDERSKRSVVAEITARKVGPVA